MFERFTDRARRAVVLAQEEARLLSHQHIGTEHLLLGLIHEGEGLASKTLEASGLTLEAVREEVTNRVGRGTEMPKGHMPFTPRAKKAMELSLRESLKLRHKYIGTEHVLLGIIREGEGVAALIMLAHVDSGLAKIEDDLMAAMAGAGAVSPSEIERIRGAQIVLGSNDEVITRLEAIEARLSAIERLLREGGAEETG